MSDTAKSSVQERHRQPLVVLVRADRIASLIGRWNQAAWPMDAFVHPFDDYRDSDRLEALDLVPLAARRVLDVGGGTGNFLARLQHLRSHLGMSVETHLAELDPVSCKKAEHQVDRVWVGDFMTHRFDSSFDCISFLDVLEHTEDPLRWLSHARSLLTHEGCIVASIPNVGHWSVIADLLEGRWDYAPVGIHCITHLRFFTWAGIEVMMQDAGFRIIKSVATKLSMPGWLATMATVPGITVDRQGLDTHNWLLCAEPC